ncbi:DNA glycosylase [Metarhizium album ARSEF 1941]|uniref:DNA glycosylase n=1 Tax=Metarhizium album (strain ARSEF 1941) TaxID=1081103 RepID=A0A0B2WL65_METAS|nr:DNA glycosylase [Metarhizium album ARSEF 1941]KHN96786.1 DNA glycosylase [Metarhizium album ARSEF 1941]
MSPAAETISKPEFAALLAAYPALIDSIQARTSTYKLQSTRRHLPPPKLTIKITASRKPNQETLKDLDTFRYHRAPLLFSQQSQQMTLPHVQRLVEWKLQADKLQWHPPPASRHGKFRPTLQSLISSNAPLAAQQAISSAVKLYRSSPQANEVQPALAALTQLKGVGPATASLLLSVHDPQNVIFFSDEAYRWLCRGGAAAAPIKYTAGEYAELSRRADELARRLGVSMIDVEKAAYVVVRGAKERAEPASDSKKRAGEDIDQAAEESARRRNTGRAGIPDKAGLRRSQRHKT